MSNELEIVGGLSSTLPEERRVAREQLDRMGNSRALKLLLSGLGSENWRIRKSAADALIAWEITPEVTKELLNLLGEFSDAAKRNAAVEVLVRIGSGAVDQLLSVLKNSDPHVRKLVVDVLGAIADPRSEAPLIGMLSDPDENVRMAVAETLANFEGSKSIDALIKLVRGPDVPMRFYAMESLAKMNSTLAVEDIRPLLSQRILRRAALAALGNCPDVESLKHLVEAILDSSRSNRLAALRSLGKLYSKRPELRDKMESNLVSHDQKQKILDILVETMNDSNLEAKRSTLILLGMFSHPDSAKVLVNAIRDSNLQPDAVEALTKLAKRSPDAVIRAFPPQDDPIRGLVENLVKDPLAESSPVITKKALKTSGISQSTSMTYAEFEDVRTILHNHFGIFFNDDMKFILEKRLARRLEILGTTDFGAYLSLLKSKTEGPGEIGEAINILTTNETYFFREKFQLKAFKEEILPAIFRENNRSGKKQLRIWSAGCSSGEEVYTIAILVEESGLFSEWDVQILGSDISSRVLMKARKGIYSKNSFRETPEDYLRVYFKQEDSGNYAIIDRIKRMVEFKAVNLVDEREVSSSGVFDVIFCRNVIIYFDLEIKRKVIDFLFSALDSQGYLLLGHSESLLNISARFDLVHLRNDMVYQKPFEVGV